MFFSRKRNLRIGDREYEAYGNLFLISNPDKTAVKISRQFSNQQKSELRAKWEIDALKGVVMISPFISNEEKQIRKIIEQQGGKIILITHEAFPERFKPAAHNFELCSEGRLLIVSMGYPVKSALTREICNEMNKLAVKITEGGRKWIKGRWKTAVFRE